MTSIKQDKRLIRWAHDNEYPTFEQLVAVTDRNLCICVSVESPGQYQVRVPVETDELVWRDATKEILNDTFWGLGTAYFDSESGEIAVAVNQDKSRKSMKLVAEVCERFPRALQYAGVIPRHRCYLCGGENPDDAVNHNGSVVPIHANCMNEKPGNNVAITQVFARPNYLLGAIAALFGGLFSTMFTFIIAYKVDTLVDILYVLLPICAMVAYRAAHGRQSPLMYPIVFSTSYLAAIVSLFGLLYMSHSMLWGYYPTLNAFLNALMQPAAFQNFQTMLLRVLIYTTFGLFLTIYYLYRTNKIRAGISPDSWLIFGGKLRIPQKLVHPVQKAPDSGSLGENGGAEEEMSSREESPAAPGPEQ